MTELRDSKGKLRGIWNPDKNIVTIRNRGVDISFTLKDDGTYELNEITVQKK